MSGNRETQGMALCVSNTDAQVYTTLHTRVQLECLLASRRTQLFEAMVPVR